MLARARPGNHQGKSLTANLRDVPGCGAATDGQIFVTMSGSAGTPRPGGLGGFEDTLKDFWGARPRRPAHGRKVAGVAAGIGYRYGIDPVIVRVAFVVATIFGGVGLSLYVLGWLFFPGANDQVSPIEALIGRGRSSMSKAFTIVLCIAFFPLSSWAFAGGWFNGGGVIGLALLVTALYLLHRSRGHENRPVAPAEEPMTVPMSTPGATAAAGADPLGVSPMLWDLPDPQPAYSPPAPARPRRRERRRNSKVGVATFGAALLVAGVGAALSATGIGWFTPQHVVGMVLAALGIGLVSGAFAGGGRGLIWLAVPLSIAGVVMTTVPVWQYSGGFGDIHATPTSAEEVQPVYSHTAGDLTLDLTKLPADSRPVVTEIRAGAGDSTVIVPETADVTYSCDARAGQVDCLGARTDGLARPGVSGKDLGSDGPGGLQLTVTVDQGAGNVEVRRG